MNITANFEQCITVVFTSGANGSLAGDTTQSVAHGGDCTPVTAVPNAGYKFVGWTGDYTGTDNPLNITNVKTSMNVTANFEEIPPEYTVTFTVGANGSLTGTKTQTIAEGDDCTSVTAVPDSNYNFTGWTGDHTGTENPLTITNVTADMNITANFAPETHTITAGAGAGGSITPSGSVTVNHGQDQAFTISHDNDYHIADVLVDGSSVGAVATYTFPTVTADHSIEASFVKNSAPTAPACNYPKNNGEIKPREPELSVSNAADADDDTLTYAFEVYADQGLNSLVTSISGVQEGVNTTEWHVGIILNDNSFYYWRARAYDGMDYSEWMDTTNFFVNTANDPPKIPTISSPPDDSEVEGLKPALEVNNATDIDLDPITYEFAVYADEGMTALTTSKTGVLEGHEGATCWQIDIALEDNTFYWWRAQARDNEDAESGWSGLSRFFVNQANNAPSAPTISSPYDEEEINSLEPTLEVTNSTDADLDTLTYFFEIDTVNTFDSPSREQSPEVDEGAGDTTGWNPSKLDDNTDYYWRVRAFDGAAYSEWTTGSFFVNLFK